MQVKDWLEGLCTPIYQGASATGAVARGELPPQSPVEQTRNLPFKRPALFGSVQTAEFASTHHLLLAE